MKILMPEKEKNKLIEEYKKSNCILEYGGGGSTFLASSMNKKIFCVESDKKWSDLISKQTNAIVHYVDIGPTKKYGHPKDFSNKKNWTNYPNSIWDIKNFEQPDLILIDGRFRVACFLISCLRTNKKIKILFDDFDRKEYQIVKNNFKINEKHGRLAIFEIEPKCFDFSNLKLLFNNFFNTI